MQLILKTLDWVEASPDDVVSVLRSAKNCLDIAMNGTTSGTIWVSQNLDLGYPITLDQLGPNGEHQIMLNTRGPYWSQYAYQFAHEYCHVRTNHNNTDDSNKWFDESICELASIFVLRRMCEEWTVNPPFDHWKSYAPVLANYAEEMIIEPSRRLPNNKSFGEWFSSEYCNLQADCHQRVKNGVIANQLLELSESDTAFWVSVKYLNAWNQFTPSCFDEYLEVWKDNVPENCFGVFDDIKDLFGR
jgi:hypothetical protein